MSNDASKIEDYSSIACESCRAKKCKCDRIIGIPVGYIMSLEARLAETEAALFQMVAEQLEAPCASGEQLLTAFQQHHARQTRSARLEGWEITSLTTVEARQRWWAEAQRALAHTTSETPQPAIKTMIRQTHSSSTTSAPVLRGESPSNSVTNNHHGPTQLSSPLAGHARYF